MATREKMMEVMKKLWSEHDEIEREINVSTDMSEIKLLSQKLSMICSFIGDLGDVIFVHDQDGR